MKTLVRMMIVLLLSVMHGVTSVADTRPLSSADMRSLSLIDKYGLIENHLNQFDQDTNYIHLEQVWRLSSSITMNNQEMGRYLLEIRLRVIAGCEKTRDKSFDLKTAKRPTTVVMPPFVAGESVKSGMPPAQIKNIEARKKYEVDIAENERLKEIYYRELLLQRTMQHCIFEVKAYLKSIKNMNEQINIDHAKSSIIKFIKDTSLANSLLTEL